MRSYEAEEQTIDTSVQVTHLFGAVLLLILISSISNVSVALGGIMGGNPREP